MKQEYFTFFIKNIYCFNMKLVCCTLINKNIVTRKNIVWKLARLFLLLLQDLFAGPKPQRVHKKKNCYQRVQHVIGIT